MTVDNKSNAIITSGNSSGKSILIKSILINTLLGQSCGISCCREFSSFKPFTNILSCIHVPDITGHASLFEAEMHRSKYILDMIKASDNNQTSLIIMDEIFNSTNPLEAISAAYAVCKKISEYSNVLLIFTTHLSYLTKLSKTSRFINYRMQTLIDSTNKITFTYTMEFEAKVTFGIVREFMYPIREFLAKQQDVAESVSARTVLNVNRIYLQERLIQVQSPLALKINGMIPKEPLKTFGDSILNFINGLPEQLKSDFFTDNPNF
jgi:hypothetical protein